MIITWIKRFLIILEYWVVSAIIFTIVEIVKLVQYIIKKWKE
jgi:hypothetical protein